MFFERYSVSICEVADVSKVHNTRTSTFSVKQSKHFHWNAWHGRWRQNASPTHCRSVPENSSFYPHRCKSQRLLKDLQTVHLCCLILTVTVTNATTKNYDSLETWRKEKMRPSPENLERWNIYSHECKRSKNGRMEQSKAMEYESRKASSDALKPRNIYIYIIFTVLKEHKHLKVTFFG
jgi:hypothetical protein